MKNLFLVFLLLSSICSVRSQTYRPSPKKCIIRGTIIGNVPQQIELTYTDSAYERNKTVIADVTSGRFNLIVRIPESERVQLTGRSIIEGKPTEYGLAQFFVDSGVVKLEIKADKYFKITSITGSQSQADYDALLLQLAPAEKEIAVFASAHTTASQNYFSARQTGQPSIVVDSLKHIMDSIDALIRPYNDRRKQLAFAFYMDHPQSAATLWFVNNWSKDYLSADSLQMIYDRLDPKLKKSWEGYTLGSDIKYRRDWQKAHPKRPDQ